MEDLPADAQEPIIIYAEDNAMVFRAAQVFFNSMHYEVYRAKDGQEIVDITRANESRIAVILMDLNMPKKSGLEAIKEIRGFSDVPIIVVTAYGNEQIKEQCKELKCCGYVEKPFDGGELLNLVQENSRKIASGWEEG